ncbi:sulfotransferase family 2 domain-containing protein [Shewanella maritima]|uniref:sulfotransferase family 2 domain-containing protein n=1 Tax=Shewanella maritima TaxID=2520507 RepID=UPI003735F059
MISFEHKCIFVHIPKVAGTSIERVIWPGERRTENLWMGFVDKFHNKYQTGGLQHLLAKQIKLEVGNDIFEQFYKFSIVRNPWDKAVSQYTYMKKRPDLREFCGMSDDSCFKSYLDLISQKQHVQWTKQTDFLLDDDGELLVNFIGRFEDLNDDVDRVFGHLGIEANLPHLNKGSREGYQRFYDSESKEIVESLYSDDIAYLNYSF